MYGRVIGFEMGPGLLRRAPRGWLPARATSVECRVRSHNYSSADGGAPVIETTFAVKVRWRIEVAGREPYEVEEERDGPAWTAGGGVGGGNRWYKVRVRPQYGLMKDVPCRASSTRPTPRISGSTGTAPTTHTSPRGSARRASGAAWGSAPTCTTGPGPAVNPFAGKVRSEDELAEVERRVEAEKPPPPPPPGPPSYFERQLAELRRIKDNGRKTRATVMRHEATNREMFSSPVVMLHFDVEGRDIVFEHCYGWRHLKHYKVGRKVDVWIDPENPDALCPGE